MAVVWTEISNETPRSSGLNLRLLGALGANLAAWGLIALVIVIAI
jgi:hypothetical protein